MHKYSNINLFYFRKFASAINVRHSEISDKEKLLYMLKTISEEDQKFLALKQKLKFVKDSIRRGRHITIAENGDGDILGFLRTSGKHGDVSTIDELYVKPESRNRGIAEKLVNYVINDHAITDAKSLNTNKNITNFLNKLNFVPDKGERVTIWKYQRDENGKKFASPKSDTWNHAYSQNLFNTHKESMLDKEGRGTKL